MDGRFTKYPLSNDHDDIDYSPENSMDSPRSGSGKIASTSSPKRSKRGVQKRVVSVPIRDVEGSRLKGESAPPSDSWAWRKYGQKPIKGSPYPRGYYRCSSSKGCPARKQVERSRADPTMLVITYSCEHNHPWPSSKGHHHHQRTTISSTSAAIAAAAAAAAEVTSVSVSTTVSNSDEEKPAVFENQLQIDTAEKFSSLGGDCLIDGYDFKWFTDFESTSSTMFESPIMGGDTEDGALVLSMREEDESLFADLGELPECSVVFRRSVAEESRRCNLAPWCGTTG